MKEYQEFIKNKLVVNFESGFDIQEKNISSILYPFQRDIVRWCLKKGKSAIFADCGLGKTLMQLEWAKHVVKKEKGNILIFAPLAVARQTKEEGKKLKLEVNICRGQEDVKDGINIANYDMFHRFDLKKFIGIVLDESSILKSYTGKFRTALIESAMEVPYKLCCTATPSPNDYEELGNHSEFLGVSTRKEMLSMFFVHDSGDTAKWRMKGHSEKDFWKWLSIWAVSLKKPSDLMYEDDGFILPELKIKINKIAFSGELKGQFFATPAKTLSERRQVKRDSLDDRILKVADMVNDNKSTWLIWCNLNDESMMLKKAIPDAVEVKGSDSQEHKEDSMIGFSQGKYRVMITKPSIAGFGMNWQHCNNVVFVGLSDSYEQYYQAIRRCWRFGQKKSVNVYVIISELESEILKNIERKEKQMISMMEGMVSHTKEITSQNLRRTRREKIIYNEDKVIGDGWDLYLGDAVEVCRKLEDESIHFSVFSPPFASLYTYSASERDMGNCKSEKDFFNHFKFLVVELHRILKQGRLISVHCMNLPRSKEMSGDMSLSDFRGDIIRLFESVGFLFHSEVCIWKDPLIAAVRTKALGLLHKQIMKDSTLSRQGVPDYVVSFRKKGDNKEFVSHPQGFTDYIGEDKIESGNESHMIWRRYASPVWMDIRQTRVLQYELAREEKDEKHICPLQLDVIERCLELWTNEGDIVISPFAGIGSEGYCSVLRSRKFIGIELKKSYFDYAVKNLKIAEQNKGVKGFGIK